MKHELPIFTSWYEITSMLLERVGRFPKNLRPTLGHRLLDRAMDVLELLVVLRYSKNREQHFVRVNLSLEQLRVLVRLAFERRLFSQKQYEDLSTQVESCGRMIGGWRRSCTQGVV